ncbi:unnamed protein product (macronuclear) [Paramecium tetraurelia]|uniref:Uncharacterized protein n=1 Tax=Paramecium tetraurelia TaxID=5888 RepID=A0DGT4_PARTE|nr:uncharacterized protein GSPATT00002380001 [Paramecium tetraurelia]CAK82251.1 unnamed protein product [Paramecium tetraurelia]|eukprot:XP_001449648.1 hypothetical protein (macronuclear) [Paramecium tetraurelia strain d4-2]
MSKNTIQKPTSPTKQSIFQTGALKNRNQSPMLGFQKQPMKSPEKSLILDESITNNNSWKQTTEIQIKNSFQAESNWKEAIESIVQNITLKLKQQETDQFIKELNSPMLTQDPSVALYQAPIEKSSSTQDLFSKIVSQETKKARAVKQFLFNQFTSNDQSLNISINSSSSAQQQQKTQINNANNKNRQNNGGSPQKFQNKQFQQEPQLDQKSNLVMNQQIKQLEQMIQSTNQQYLLLQEQFKKQNSDLSNQVSSQASKILLLESFFNKIDQEQSREKYIIHQQQIKNEKQELSENTTNQEVQKQLQLVMKNLNSLAEHQQQQMMIIKTALTTELRKEFLCSSEYKQNQQELQTQLTILKDSLGHTDKKIIDDRKLKSRNKKFNEYKQIEK